MIVSGRQDIPVLEARWSRIRAICDQRDLDAVLIGATDDYMGGHLRWLTGSPAYNGYGRYAIIGRSGPLAIIEHGVQAASQVRRFGDHDVRVTFVAAFRSAPSSMQAEHEAVFQEVSRLQIRRLGCLSPDLLAFGVARRLREAGVAMVDVADDVDRLKAIKSRIELDQMRATARLQDDVLDVVLRTIRPGMSVSDVINLCKAEATSRGATQGLYLVAAGPQGLSRQWHRLHEAPRTLEYDDVIDVLIETNGPAGLWTEIGRPMVLGSAKVGTRDAFAWAKEAQAKVVNEMVSDAIPAVIARLDDEYSDVHQLPRNRRLLAHGQGYDLVERPLIRADETLELAENMCIAVHPTYLLNDGFGHICDDYILTSGAAERIHTTPQELFEV